MTECYWQINNIGGSSIRTTAYFYIWNYKSFGYIKSSDLEKFFRKVKKSQKVLDFLKNMVII